MSKDKKKKSSGRTFLIVNILLALITAGILWLLLSQGGLNPAPSNNLSAQGLSDNDRKEIADLQTQIALEKARAEQTREQMRARQLEDELRTEKARTAALSKQAPSSDMAIIKALNMDIEKEKLRIKKMIAAQTVRLERNKQLSLALKQKDQELESVKRQNVSLTQQIQNIGTNAKDLMDQLNARAENQISTSDQSYIDILQGRGKKPAAPTGKIDLINRIEIADSSNKSSSNFNLRSTVDSLMEKDKPADTFNVAVISPSTAPVTRNSIQARVDALLAQSGERATQKQLAQDNAYLDSLTPLAAERSNETRFVTVRKGDTLSLIAQRAYGDPLEYPKIFRANPQVLNNPDRINPGQRLRVPF